MTKQWVRCLLVGAMLALSVGSAQAVVKFDNLPLLATIPSAGQSQTADADGNQMYLAQSFTTDAGPYLGIGSITLYMDLNTTGTGNAQVSLWSDNPLYSTTTPVPLNQLSVLTSPAAINTMGNYTFTSPGVALLANTTYWVVLSSTGTAVFDWGYTDMTVTNPLGPNNAWYPIDPANVPNFVTAPFAEAYVDGQNWGSDITMPFQMQVDAVPEPSTYALLVISLGVVGYARKKMNLKA